MKHLLIFGSLLIMLGSCKKEEKKYDVIYKVIVIGGNPSYSVTYSSAGNSTQTAGPFTDSKWVSPTISDRKAGSTVSLTLKGGSGGSYNMYIYVNGRLEKEDRMDDPYGPRTISVELPED
jgi:hypothetical protein